MHWYNELVGGNAVAHALTVLSLVAALGIGIGTIRVRGISLGIAGVLFSGLAFGHFGASIDHAVLDFTREFGLVIFVYTIGIQVGPGFAASLKRHGLPLNLLAAAIVFLGVALTVLLIYYAGIAPPAAVGLFSGATTNTPSLGAAQQALKDIPNADVTALTAPGLGYAVAYPFGIIGTILSMIVVRSLFRIDVRKEVLAVTEEEAEPSAPQALNLEVRNPDIDGLTVREIPGLAASRFAISRVRHGDSVEIAGPDTRLRVGDVVLAVGPRSAVDEIKALVGPPVDIDLREVPSGLIIRRVVVTRQKALGKTIRELDLRHRYGVTVTRVSRAEIEFAASAGFRLQFGDTVRVVGTEQAVADVARELGDSVQRLNHPQLIPIFVGIALGILLGSLPIAVPGIPAPVRLGLAGGPLIVAIVLSRIGQIGPLSYYMPISANFMLREVGIVLFLACVGLGAGSRFVQTLTQGDGFYWMACAAAITFVPLIVVAPLARIVLKLNYVSLCGLLAGSMTDPPALAFAASATGSDAPAASYATVYPLVMLMRVISAQALILIFAP